MQSNDSTTNGHKEIWFVADVIDSATNDDPCNISGVLYDSFDAIGSVVGTPYSWPMNSWGSGCREHAMQHFLQWLYCNIQLVDNNYCVRLNIITWGTTAKGSLEDMYRYLSFDQCKHCHYDGMAILDLDPDFSEDGKELAKVAIRSFSSRAEGLRMQKVLERHQGFNTVVNTQLLATIIKNVAGCYGWELVEQCVKKTFSEITSSEDVASECGTIVYECESYDSFESSDDE